MKRLVVAAALFLFVLPAVGQSLRVNRPIEASLDSDGADTYTFTANADQFVLLFVNQKTMDVVVTVNGPEGEVTTVDGPARGNEIVQFDTEVAGTYTVEVTPFEEAEGAYSIVLKRLERVATKPDARVKQLLSPYDSELSPGAAVAVYRDGKTIFSHAVGMANLSYGVPFEPTTPTNIGSTSKQFTAFAIMLLVEQGMVSLDSDVREYLPDLPDLGETVTVRNLLTHTSGYREFLNLLILGGLRLGEGDYVDRAWLTELIQRQPALQNSPGAEWNYSNTAFGLAAQIVEAVTEEDFPDWMKDNVFGPLGMDHTLVRATPETPIPGMSLGYAGGADGFAEKRDLWGAVGAGGIYATVLDLGKWVANFNDPRVGSASIIEQMSTPFVLSSGDTTGYGLGVFIDDQRGLSRIQHGGADIAHRSMLMIFPEINAGVTTQSNHAAFDGSIAEEIAEVFFGEYMEPEEEEESAEDAEFDPETYDPEAFDDFAGRYSLDEMPTFVLTFTRDGETLYTQATGQSQLEISPTSDSTFALTGVEASVTFRRDSEGVVTGLILNQNGLHPATRLSDEDEAWSPDLDELQTFTGRFFSDELDTTYQVVVEDSSLVVQHRRLDDISLTPGEADTFSSNVISELSFERDRNAQIIGFYVSNGRTRSVRFEKVK